jgi:hypothetical protein
MKSTSATNRGIRVRATIRAGSLKPQHARKILGREDGLDGWGLSAQRGGRVLRVKAGLKAGGVQAQHNRGALSVKDHAAGLP